MAQTVSDFIIRRLHEWGVERVYGYSEDGINGVTAGLRRAEDGPRMIQPRHEELAGFMASAHVKFTGTPGVFIATSGPGAVHLLNGLYDAQKDHMPAVAFVGQQARAVQIDIDAKALGSKACVSTRRSTRRIGSTMSGPGH